MENFAQPVLVSHRFRIHKYWVKEEKKESKSQILPKYTVNHMISKRNYNVRVNKMKITWNKKK